MLSRTSPAVLWLALSCAGDPGKKDAPCAQRDCDAGGGDGTATGGAAGAAGVAGTSGSAGSAGSAATGGAAGAAATGGAAGAAGTGGAAGAAATGGAAGAAATGGAAGIAGTGGAAGAAGTGATGGAAGSDGGGAAGTAGAGGGNPCDSNNGGCDPLTTCTSHDGGVACGPCPPGTTGTGATGCVPEPVTVALVAVANAAEGGAPGTFRLTRTGAAVGALTVRLQVSAASRARWTSTGVGTDVAFTGPVTTSTGQPIDVLFAAGESSVDVTVEAIDDEHAEEAETLTVTLVDGAAYQGAAPREATVTIARNDFHVIHLQDSLTDYAVREGSLRLALENSDALPGHDVVTFETGLTGTVVLVGQLPVTNLFSSGGVTIDGPGAQQLTLHGSLTHRIVETRGTTVLRGLRIVEGDSNVGGGLLNRGHLTLEGVVFERNRSSRGSAIASFSPAGTEVVEIRGCSFFDHVGGTGAVEITTGTCSVQGSTFSGNSPANFAGVCTNLGGNTPANP